MRARRPDGDIVDLMTVNIGPSHPATHGTLRICAAIEGETIVAGVGAAPAICSMVIAMLEPRMLHGCRNYVCINA